MAGNAGKGRPKGALNKNTAEIKEMILTALSNKGGHEYLERQADENPTAFMTLLGKVLPMQVNVADHEGGRLIPVINVTIGTGTASPPKAG